MLSVENCSLTRVLCGLLKLLINFWLDIKSVRASVRKLFPFHVLL